MKKKLLVIMTILGCLALSGCGNGVVKNAKNKVVEDALNHTAEVTNPSPDKYTWYVKDYVGKNAKSIGYRDKYGEGTLEIIYVSNDGSHVTSDNLDEYIVINQNLAPNTEIKYVFDKLYDGSEASWIDTQNIEEIELKVAKVSFEKEKTAETKNTNFGIVSGKQKISETTTAKVTHTPQAIKTSPDKYTWYVKDYVGRNLETCGYTSIGGDRLDRYGDGTIELIINTSDGNYINIIDNDEELKHYVVVSQSVAPNTEIKYVFDKLSDGSESSFIDTQSIEEIQLQVERIDN